MDLEAPDRVEQVIDKVRGLAKSEKIDPNIVEQIYRAMITSFITQEKIALKQNE